MAAAAGAGRAALASVVATSYLLGVSTRRVEKLAEQLRVTKLSMSQVSVLARKLDEMVTDFRNGHWTPIPPVDALRAGLTGSGFPGDTRGFLAIGGYAGLAVLDITWPSDHS